MYVVIFIKQSVSKFLYIIPHACGMFLIYSIAPYSRITNGQQAAGHHHLDFISAHSNLSFLSTFESEAQNVVHPKMMMTKKLPRDEQTSMDSKLEMNESAPIKQRGNPHSDNI